MSDPYLASASTFQHKYGSAPAVVHKVLGSGTEWSSFGVARDNLQAAGLYVPDQPADSPGEIVPVHGRELRTVGVGVGANATNMPSPSPRAHYFHTTAAPSAEVTHFPVLRYVVSPNPYVPGCTNPFVRTGAINKLGVTGVEVAGPNVKTPYLGSKQWHSSELGSVLTSHVPSLRFTPMGYLREYRLAKETWLCHHDFDVLRPEVAAIVVSSLSFIGQTSTSYMDELLIVGVSSARQDGLRKFNSFYRPVLVQNGRVLIAPATKTISTSLDFRHPTQTLQNRIQAQYGDVTLYRGSGQNDYRPNDVRYPNNVAAYNAKELHQLHSVTTEATWLDVTNFPDVSAYDIDLSNDGPPTLMGYGYIAEVPYGLTPATNRCIGFQDPVPVIEVLFRVDDNQCRNIFNALIQDGTNKTCVYTWDYTVESYFTQLGWVLTSNNCGPGYTAVPPYTAGTFQGEKRDGTCQI
jgi:hypothetical protein